MEFLTSNRSKQHWFAFLSRFLKINFAIYLFKYEINVMKYLTFLSKEELHLHCIASDICWILQKARKLYVKVSKNWYKKHINELFPSLLLFWKEAGNLGSKFNFLQRMKKCISIQSRLLFAVWFDLVILVSVPHWTCQ